MFRNSEYQKVKYSSLHFSYYAEKTLYFFIHLSLQTHTVSVPNSFYLKYLPPGNGIANTNVKMVLIN